MQTGSQTQSGSQVTGYTSTETTANTSLRDHIGGTDAAWLAAFGTQSPYLPAGSRIFLQAAGGTVTVAGGIVGQNVTTTASAPLIVLQCNNADNIPLTLSAGTLRITIES